MWYVPLALFAMNCTPDDLRIEASDVCEMIQQYVTLSDQVAYLSTMTAGVASTHILGEVGDLKSDVLQMLTAIIAVIDIMMAPILMTNGNAIREKNIAKLRQRYPDKYSDEAAEARADKGGLDARQS
jgi:hypothetical protein